MKDGFNKHKWTTAGGAYAASFLEKWLRDKFDEAMHSMIDAHPFTKRFLQMFFDSDLDSEIERNAYMAITDAIISTVEELTKDGPLSKFHDVIVPIVHFVCKKMFLLKLAYHANAGRISKEQFCERAAEHLAVETAAFLEKAWNIIPALLEKGKVGLVGVLVYFGMDQASAIQTADNINDFLLFLHPIVKKFMTKDNIQKLLIRTIEITIDASRIVLKYAEKVSNKVRDLYGTVESILKSWGRMFYQKFGWIVPDFLKEESSKEVDLNDKKLNKEDNHSKEGFLSEIEDEQEKEDVEDEVEDKESETEDVEDEQITKRKTRKKKKDRTKSK